MSLMKFETTADVCSSAIHIRSSFNKLRTGAFLPLAAILLFFAVSSASAATNWYVDPAGNNANTCLAPGPANACLTIQGAVTKSASGDTVIIAAGNYAAGANLNKSLTLQGAQAGVDARNGRPA